MYTEPTEITKEEAETILKLDNVGVVSAFGGFNIDADFVILYSGEKFVVTPQEFLWANHDEVGSTLNAKHHLIKEILNLQEQEISKIIS